jgi:hypothetical protein
MMTPNMQFIFLITNILKTKLKELDIAKIGGG